MKGLSYPRVALVLVLLSSAAVSFAASVDPALLKAKQEAESKGYLFITNREEIVAKAKQEGKLHVLTGMEPPTLKASAAAFKKRYPFIDLHIQETTGTEGDERQILEIKSGARDWDIHRLAVDRYSDYLPYLLKIDILGMVQRGVLQIPPPLFDPGHRNALAFYNRFVVTAYNKNLIPPNQVPKAWEDLLKPGLKGRKFAADIRPQNLGAALLWFEWMASAEAQKIADEQEPFASSVFVRGGAVEQELKGKKLSVVGWEHHQNVNAWEAKIVQAYGFPKAEVKR